MVLPAKRQLISLLLLVTVLALPFASFAHAFAAACTAGDCACVTLVDPAFPGDGGGEPGPGPGTGTGGSGDCCDAGECGSDLNEARSELIFVFDLSRAQAFKSLLTAFPPKVYLPIFVPPES